jgi:DNA-directed RNA polymerase specialized sigma24 family protein
MAPRADIAGRDLSGLESVYRLNVRRVYTLCLRLLADARLAEEATALAFARLDREPPRPLGDERLLGLAVEESLARLGEAVCAENVPAALQGIDALAARLPGRLRAAFVLNDIEGMSAAAVAGCLRLDEAAARLLVREARQALRRMGFGGGRSEHTR